MSKLRYKLKNLLIEEDNPEKACEIYPYAKEYLNKYPNLNNETI